MRAHFCLPDVAQPTMFLPVCGGVAQSVERGSHKPCVDGSSPSLATTKRVYSPVHPEHWRMYDLQQTHKKCEKELHCVDNPVSPRERQFPPWRSFGDRLMVGQRPLEPSMKVRILLPELTRKYAYYADRQSVSVVFWS